MKTKLSLILTMIVCTIVSCEFFFDPVEETKENEATLNVSADSLNFKTGESQIITVEPIGIDKKINSDEYVVNIFQNGKNTQDFLAYYLSGNILRIWPYANGVGSIEITHPSVNDKTYTAIQVKLNPEEEFIIQKDDVGDNGRIKPENERIRIMANQSTLFFDTPDPQIVTMSASKPIDISLYDVDVSDANFLAHYNPSGKQDEVIFIPYKNGDGTIQIKHPEANNTLSIGATVDVPPGQEFFIDEDDVREDGSVDLDDLDDIQKRRDLKEKIDSISGDPVNTQTTDGKPLVLEMPEPYRRINVYDETTIKLRTNAPGSLITWKLSPTGVGRIVNDGGTEAIFIPSKNGDFTITASIGTKETKMEVNVELIPNNIQTFKAVEEVYKFSTEEQIVPVSVILIRNDSDGQNPPLEWVIEDDSIVGFAAQNNPEITSRNLRITKIGSTKITVRDPLTGEFCEFSVIVSSPSTSESRINIRVDKREIQIGAGEVIYRLEGESQPGEVFTWTSEPSDLVDIITYEDGRWATVEPQKLGAFAITATSDQGRIAKTRPIQITEDHFLNILTPANAKRAYIPGEITFDVNSYVASSIEIEAFPEPRVKSIEDLQSLSSDATLKIRQIGAGENRRYRYSVISYGQSAYQVVIEAGEVTQTFYVITAYNRKAELTREDGTKVPGSPQLMHGSLEPIMISVDNADDLIASAINLTITSDPPSEISDVDVSVEEGTDIINIHRHKENIRIKPLKEGKATISLTDNRENADEENQYYTVYVQASDQFFVNHPIKVTTTINRDNTAKDDSLSYWDNRKWNSSRSVPNGIVAIPDDLKRSWKEVANRSYRSGVPYWHPNYRHNYEWYKNQRIVQTFKVHPFIDVKEFVPNIIVSGNYAWATVTLTHAGLLGGPTKYYYLYGNSTPKTEILLGVETEVLGWGIEGKTNNVVANFHRVTYTNDFSYSPAKTYLKKEFPFSTRNHNIWNDGVRYSKFSFNQSDKRWELTTTIYLPDLAMSPQGEFNRYLNMTIETGHYIKHGPEEKETYLKKSSSDHLGDSHRNHLQFVGRNEITADWSQYWYKYYLLKVPATPTTLAY